MFKQRLIQRLKIKFKLNNISCKYEKRSSDYGKFNEMRQRKQQNEAVCEWFISVILAQYSDKSEPHCVCLWCVYSVFK